MPNHITNRIKLIGEPSEIHRVMEAVKVDDFGLGSLDFNKVIPMPADVFKGDLGEKERELYGNNNWYDWSVANWGTKWNSYGYENFETAENADTISFLTAWSAPHPVIEKLSQMFPTITIEHEWADEDIGMNCGRRTYYDGERVEEYYPDYGKESLEFTAAVMDRQLEEDFGLYLNASETGYINIEYDDEFELIELFGKPALFTNERITDVDIPKGMYSYQIRHGDDGEFCAVEKRVNVNHAGSVVTKEPLDLGSQGYISFTDDTSPNFTGETMSLYEFREYAPEQSEDENLGMEVPQ
ncbi:hypothetical protein SAMN02910447_03163 [Ruminococcus sp. YE71]|uniref:LPD28 domain-containing protein n=1 Tax=unclassified Ruminococcus TaxID=2608920 RepID=UPI00088D3112|nr:MULTISPECIES: LPD28 domain-containing protein [unclassified Ruminococcus]SDA30295.1 hypothetical protein SAMN02910446_03234 [Ruminococcus sp. YE78]SFW49372.1 hypothetical protein SAMN02910447_03163 [Ruminococcus sp. YE71]